MTTRSAAAQATELVDQACSRMSRCSARVQRLAGLGRSNDHKGLAEFKPLACGRKKPSEVEFRHVRALKSDMHNARFTNKKEDRYVACTVFASRRVGMRTGLSQLVVTCALAMLLIASPHGAEGRCTTTCLPPTQLLPVRSCAHTGMLRRPAKVPTLMLAAASPAPHTAVTSRDPCHACSASCHTLV